MRRCLGHGVVGLEHRRVCGHLSLLGLLRRVEVSAVSIRVDRLLRLLLDGMRLIPGG